MRKIIIAAASLGVATVGAAQTYSVEPGLWEIEGESLLGGVERPIDGTQCVSPQNAQLDVSEALAEALDRTGNTNCEFDHSNGRDFSLSCVGDATLTASGTLQVDSLRVEVDGTGIVVVDGAADLPASIKATFNHVGSCPAP